MLPCVLIRSIDLVTICVLNWFVGELCANLVINVDNRGDDMSLFKDVLCDAVREW